MTKNFLYSCVLLLFLFYWGSDFLKIDTVSTDSASIYSSFIQNEENYKAFGYSSEYFSTENEFKTDNIDESCEFPTPSPFFFEDGWGNLKTVELANDIELPSGVNFYLNSIQFNALIEENSQINDVRVRFYTDSADGPGENIGEQTVVPTAIETIGQVSAYQQAQVSLDLSPVEMTSGSLHTLYWVGITLVGYSGTDSFMETTYQMNTPNEAWYGTLDSNGNVTDWEPGSVILNAMAMDGVISFFGNCDSFDICAGPNNFIIQNSYSTSATTSWNIDETPANGYLLEVYHSGEAPENSNPVYSATIDSNSVSANINGLEPLTLYDAYLTAHCSNSESSDTVTVSFQTTMAYDDCEGAIPLTVGSSFENSLITTSNIGGTVTPNAPMPACGYLSPDSSDIWFTVTIPSSGAIMIETDQADAEPMLTNTTIEVYSGSCDELVQIDCNDDKIQYEDLYSFLYITGQEPGAELKIRVWGWFGEEGNFKIGAYLPECPPVVDLEVNNITSSNADLSWNPIGEETLWDISYGVDLSSPTDSGAILTQTSESEVSLSNLEEASNYNVYVRPLCGTGNEEDNWTEINFMTTLDGGYCLPIFPNGCSSGDVIDSFLINGENGTSIVDLDTGCSTSSYDNRIPYTNVVDLKSDSSYQGMVLTHNSSDAIAIWIDFNDDGIFEESERVLAFDNLLQDTETGFTLDIPNTTDLGEHRMRVMVSWIFSATTFDPCNEDNGNPKYYFGETHDYMVNIIAGSDCSRPSNVLADSITDTEADISWTPIGTEINWIVKYGLNGFNPDIEGEALEINDEPGTHLSNLTENTTYQVYVKALCEPGVWESSWSIAGTFTTDLTGGYCVPDFPTGCIQGDLIDSFTLEGENGTLIEDLNTGCSEGAYQNRIPFTDTVDLIPGNVYLSKLITWNYGNFATAWIDYNDNGIFEETERVAGNISPLPAGEEGTLTISISPTALQGEHRMRVMIGASASSSEIDPCNANYFLTYGEAHDYMVNILEAPDCFPVNGIATPNITDTTAKVTWNPGFEETEWKVEYGLTGFDLGEGTVITVTETPEVTLTNLTSESSYDIYVTAVCTDGDANVVGPFSVTTFADGGCGQNTPSNDFEGGYGPFHLTVWANDFVIAPEETFHLSRFNFNAIIDPGALITGVEIHLYEDSGNGPGQQIDNSQVIVPTSTTVIGESFGFDVVAVQVDFENTIELTGDSDGGSIYWIGARINFTGANAFWEITSIIDTPNPIYSRGSDGVWYDTHDLGLGDGVMSIEGICGDLSIKDEAFKDFVYYPNPTSSQVFLKAKTPIEQITIYNLNGSQLINQKSNIKEISIDLEGLNAGIYLMKVNTGNRSKTFKIIKK